MAFFVTSQVNQNINNLAKLDGSEDIPNKK